MGRLQPARRAARTSQARVLRFLPRERESARAVLTSARTQVSCSFGGRGWHVGARPCTEGDGRPAGAAGFHRVWTDANQHGAARARRKRACCASSPLRESARGLRFLTCARTQVSCSFGGRGWHVGARPCTEGDGRSAGGAVGFHRAWADSNQRGAARARRKRTCCASSRERASEMERLRTSTRASRLFVGGNSWHVGARPCIEVKGGLAGAVGIHVDDST